MNTTLLQLGWKPHFPQQLSLEDLENYAIYRIFERHRSQIVCLGSEHYSQPKFLRLRTISATSLSEIGCSLIATIK